MSKSRRIHQPAKSTYSETSRGSTVIDTQSPHHFGASTSAEVQRELYAEQVRQLYSNAMLGLLGSAINSLILVVIQRDVTSPISLITWVLLVAVISLVRYCDIRAYWRRPPEASAAERWGTKFTVGLALSGIAWGSSAIFLFPAESLAHQTFLAFAVGGMVAGAAAAFSSRMKSFLAYSVPALSPIVIRFVLARDEIHLAMGGMTLLFGVMMFFVAKRINTVRIASVKLRFQNTDLVSYLTEHKRMEEALRENEEKYRNLVEQSLQGIFVIQDMRIVFSNQAFAEMLGYTLEELHSLTPQEVINIVHRGDQERVWNQYREKLEGKPSRPTYNEFRARRKDGSIAWAECAAVRVTYNGRPAVQISIVDTSQRREVERALHDSQSRLETMFAAIPDPIVEYDADGRPVLVNTAALTLAGITSSTFEKDRSIAMPELKNLDGNPVSTEDLPASRALKGETVTNDLYSITSSGGDERIISAYAVPFFKEGKVNGVVGLWHDITELKKTEKAFKKIRDELEERVSERTALLNSAYDVLQVEVEERRRVEKELRILTMAIEQAVEGVFVNSPEGAIIYANKAFCRMLAYSEEELIGTYIWSTRADDHH